MPVAQIPPTSRPHPKNEKMPPQPITPSEKLKDAAWAPTLVE